MKPSVEISIDLTTQELLDPPPLESMIATSLVEVEDIGDIDPLLQTGSFVANADQRTGTLPAAATDEEISIEIELTAEQMDDLLQPPRR